jgi:hypothetical protein
MKAAIVQGARQPSVHRVLVIAGSVPAPAALVRKSSNGSPRSAGMSWARNLRSSISKTGRCPWPVRARHRCRAPRDRALRAGRPAAHRG